MYQLLVYSDSLSWGIIPATRNRLAFDRRWPGVMENSLAALGKSVRVIEDCLNGRRTVSEDPFKPGRNGLDGLAQRIEIHSPLSLVILLLGTNDFQSVLPATNARRCSAAKENRTVWRRRTSEYVRKPAAISLIRAPSSRRAMSMASILIPTNISLWVRRWHSE